MDLALVCGPDATSRYHSSDSAEASTDIDRTRLAALEQRLAESELRWRAMEARMVGLARRLDIFSEQISEVKMLVKIFEEKLDNEG